MTITDHLIGQARRRHAVSLRPGGPIPLAQLPATVLVSSAAAGGAVDGGFLGADLAEPASHHVVSLGALRVPTLRTREKYVRFSLHSALILVWATTTAQGRAVHGVFPEQAVVDVAAGGG